MQIDGNRFDNLISDTPQILNYVMALHILLLFYTLYVTWGENGPKITTVVSPMCRWTGS